MIERLLWILKGRKMVKYKGTHCGCCGAWTAKEFEVPEYLSDWGDRWSVCDKCLKGLF